MYCTDCNDLIIEYLYCITSVDFVFYPSLGVAFLFDS